MLRTLLSPLSSRFPISPRPDTAPVIPDNDEPAPEDFARDVLVEVMRNTVERLKVAEGLSSRTQVFTLVIPGNVYPYARRYWSRYTV